MTRLQLYMPKRSLERAALVESCWNVQHWRWTGYKGDGQNSVSHVTRVAEERKSFQRELKTHIHAVRHCDGICKLYGTYEWGHRLSLVMKMYEGDSLDKKIRDGPLDRMLTSSATTPMRSAARLGSYMGVVLWYGILSLRTSSSILLTNRSSLTLVSPRS
jgi:hypothetical protein